MDTDVDLPIFVQTAPSCVNYCGSCGVPDTSGCWRRGWNLSGNLYINLCNRCGLRYKNGKLPPFYSSAERDAAGPTIKSLRQFDNRLPGKLGPAKRIKPNGSLPLGIRQPNVNCREPLQSVAVRLQPSPRHPGGHSEHYSVPVLPSGTVAMQLPAAAPGGRYMMKRTTAPEGQNVHFYVEGDDGTWRLAAVGVDTRGSGHFTYIAEHDFGGPSALRCTNRCKVLDWLASMGYTEGLDPSAVSSEASPLDSEGQHTAWQQEGWNFANSAGHLQSSPLAMGPSSEVVSAFSSQPELLEWVAGIPDDDSLARFQSWASQLLAVVGEEAPPGCRDVPNLSWVLASDAMAILNELETWPVSLRLLEASGLSRPVAALRSHRDPELAAAASRVAAKWRGIAAAALNTASQALLQGH